MVFRDRQRFSATRPRLAQFGGSDPTGDDWWPEFRDVSSDWLAPGEERTVDLFVEYSDERGLQRYKRTIQFRVQQPAGEGHPPPLIDEDAPLTRRLS
jgi:hypothetical protein